MNSCNLFTILTPYILDDGCRYSTYQYFGLCSNNILLMGGCLVCLCLSRIILTVQPHLNLCCAYAITGILILIITTELNCSNLITLYTGTETNKDQDFCDLLEIRIHQDEWIQWMQWAQWELKFVPVYVVYMGRGDWYCVRGFNFKFKTSYL